jgi:hypothetical protein
MLGQKQIGPKMALKYDVKLIMYGESQAEGGNNISEAMDPIMNPRYYSAPESDCMNVRLGGVEYAELIDRGFEPQDLSVYLPVSRERVEASRIEVHHMGFYEHWRAQDKYYYAVENCGFQPNPERTEGTYSKYVSLDDKIDGFHYYTTYIKYGIGRATYDAAQEVRDRHISREEGVALIHRYDGEFPKKYFNEFLDYISITEERFWELVDSYRSPHLWKKVGNDWQLRHIVE